MVVVGGSVPTKPEMRAEIEAAVREVVEQTKPEPGCRRYDFYWDVRDPNILGVLEEWETRAHLDAHLAQPHTVRFLSMVPQFASGPVDVKIYAVESFDTL